MALLVRVSGKLVHARDENGETALHRAARWGRSDCIAVLLRADACVRAIDGDGRTPLMVCGLRAEVPGQGLHRGARSAARKAFYAAPPGRGEPPLLILHHRDFDLHAPKAGTQHQETPARTDAILKKLERALEKYEARWADAFEPASLDAVRLAHNARYVAFLEELCGEASPSTPLAVTPRLQRRLEHLPRGSIKPEASSDTFMSAGSLKAALRAVGAALHATDEVLRGGGGPRAAFVASRPPGHHAGINGCTHDACGCGFCLLNNVAIGAIYAIQRWRPPATPLLARRGWGGAGTGSFGRASTGSAASGASEATTAAVPVRAASAAPEVAGGAAEGVGAGWRGAPPRHVRAPDRDPAESPRAAPGSSPGAWGGGESGPITRVAIVDFDVHHGNGTEEIVRAFNSQQQETALRRGTPAHEVPRIFFSSIHLYDTGEGSREFYPGTGGDDRMAQFVMNIPVDPLWKATPDAPASQGRAAAGTLGRHEFCRKARERLFPSLRAFQAQLIFISAGFDAGEADIGNQRPDEHEVSQAGSDLRPEDFEFLTRGVMAVAAASGAGVVSCLEGGYGRMRAGQCVMDKLIANVAAHTAALVGRGA